MEVVRKLQEELEQWLQEEGDIPLRNIAVGGGGGDSSLELVIDSNGGDLKVNATIAVLLGLEAFERSIGYQDCSADIFTRESVQTGEVSGFLWLDTR